MNFNGQQVCAFRCLWRCSQRRAAPLGSEAIKNKCFCTTHFLHGKPNPSFERTEAADQRRTVEPARSKPDLSDERHSELHIGSPGSNCQVRALSAQASANRVRSHLCNPFNHRPSTRHPTETSCQPIIHQRLQLSTSSRHHPSHSDRPAEQRK